MKAAVLTEPKHFEVREVPKPEIGPDEALIKVERCCICGTDIHIFNGHYAAEELPLVPGHEFVGRIAAIGEKVTHLTVGSKAVVDIVPGAARTGRLEGKKAMDQKTPILSPPSEPRTFGFFVGGERIEAGERAFFERKSPAHGVPVTRVPRCARDDLDKAVSATRRAFEEYTQVKSVHIEIGKRDHWIK